MQQAAIQELITLIVQATEVSEEALRKELAPLTLSQLRAAALACPAVKAETVDERLDSDRPQEELICLVLEHRMETGAAVSAEAAARQQLWERLCRRW